MNSATLQRAIGVYEAARVRGWVIQIGDVALLYYYATTFDEEVANIWPQPAFKLGKLLFLTTRYSSIISIILSTMSNSANFADFSTDDCRVISRLYDVLRPISRTSADAMLWVCLYALLEGKRKFLYLLGALFAGLTIPGLVITWINSSRAFNVPPDVVGKAVGFPCNWNTSNYSSTLLTATAYIALTRAAIAFIIGAVVLAKRYRKHNNLITVIIREGGIYYTSACILIFLNGLFVTPGFPVRDVYQISAIMRWTFVFIFSDRLLLKLQRTNDPGTQGVVSTLLFKHDKRVGGSTESIGSDLDLGREEGEGEQRWAELRPVGTGLAAGDVEKNAVTS